MNINNKEWHICKICKKTIKLLAPIYGGGGVYLTQVFLKHLKIDHGLTYNEYFFNTCKLKRKKCPCKICNKYLSIIIQGSKFRYKKYACGRNPGQQKWSQDAKITRKGAGNPMYKKIPWNKDETKFTHPSVLQTSIKTKGRTTPLKVRQKQKESALKRTVHGHTGHKHTAENKEKFRQNTLKMIKDGKFNQNETKPVKEFSKLLRKLNILFEREKIVEFWSVDFYLPKYNIYIEVDGDYFHSNIKFYPNGPKTKTQKVNFYRDLKKNNYFKNNNLSLTRFWEDDIINNIKQIEKELCNLLKLNP
jgi:very-short-patch-repair endonuclease